MKMGKHDFSSLQSCGLELFQLPSKRLTQLTSEHILSLWVTMSISELSHHSAELNRHIHENSLRCIFSYIYYSSMMMWAQQSVVTKPYDFIILHNVSLLSLSLSLWYITAVIRRSQSVWISISKWTKLSEEQLRHTALNTCRNWQDERETQTLIFDSLSRHSNNSRVWTTTNVVAH